MNTTLAEDMVRRNAPVSDEEVADLDLDDALTELLSEITREPRTDPDPQPQAARIAPRRWLPRLRPINPAMAGMLAVACLAVIAVPPVRGALGDLGSSLGDYLDGDDPPGRALQSSDSPPAWLVADGQSGQRVIASSGPYSLYLANEDGTYNFGLDDSVAIGDSAAGWERQFANDSVVVLGPGGRADEDVDVPLYGVTAGDVAEVEIRYADGSTTTAPASTGGFVLMLDPTKSPTDLVASAPDGTSIQTIDARRFDLGARRTDAPTSHPTTVPEDAISIPD